MKHYKCFIRMVKCLDDEVPLFTRALWLLCVLAPYVVTGIFLGPEALGVLIGATTIIIVSWMFWYDFGDTIKYQCRTLPTAFKKCWECRRDDE